MQSGELQVVETIDYHFTPHTKHGIYRNIPHMSKIDGYRFDIGLLDFNITQDGKLAEWTIDRNYNDGKETYLRIGSPITTVSGLHRYQIAYYVKHGVVPASENDILDAIRFNFIGTQWNIPISNINIQIHLPVSLTQQDINLSAYTGKYGSTDSQANTHWIDKHTLQITVDKLPSYEGVTVELAYPAGKLKQTAEVLREKAKIYQQKMAVLIKEKKRKLEEQKKEVQDHINAYDVEYLVHKGKYGHYSANLYPINWLLEHFYLFVILFLGYLYSIRNFFMPGTGKYRAIMVQYNAPEGFSVLQSGVLLDKHADAEDITAAIVELAQLGYLEIVDVEETTTLKRLPKEKKDLTEDQHYLLETVLFPKEDTFELVQGDKERAGRLNRGIMSLISYLYSWAIEKSFLLENTKNIRKKFIFRSFFAYLTVYLLLLYILNLSYGLERDFELMLIASAILGAFGLIAFSVSHRNWITGVVVIPLGISLLLALYVAYIVPHDDLYSVPFVLLWIMALMMLLIIYMGNKRIGHLTPKGRALQNHLFGLKEFVLRADTDRINRLLQDDPLYLERMLPYAMIFGLTEHWMGQFERFSVAPPTWYQSHKPLYMLRSSVGSASFVPSSGSSFDAYSSSGNSSGGGGYSGGGSGGGGGGSW